MSHKPYTPEEYKKNVRKIWTTTAILSFVTLLEVGVAVGVEMEYMYLAAFVSVVSIIKAVYIMGVFMHVGHETKGFKFSVLFPFILLIWGFVSFSLDGASFAAMRNAMNSILLNWGF